MMRGIAIISAVVLVGAGLVQTGCATKDTARPAPEQPAPAATVAAVEPVKKVEEGPAPAAGATKPWLTQPVPADANANTRSVADALKNKNHPERLSPMIAPPPFSLEAYRKNPQAYLDESVPGRAFQSAQPGPGVPVLELVGPPPATLERGASVILTVKTAPSGVVSWTTMDLGSFQNQLSAISVPADENGLASVTFTATPGVTGRVNVLAGSPMATGQVSFRLEVAGSPVRPAPVEPATK